MKLGAIPRWTVLEKSVNAIYVYEIASVSEPQATKLIQRQVTIQFDLSLLPSFCDCCFVDAISQSNVCCSSTISLAGIFIRFLAAILVVCGATLQISILFLSG